MAERPLQHGYSALHPGAIFDEESRRRKADKTLAILADFIGDLRPLSLLDIGCGAGRSTQWYADRVRLAIGVDIDVDAVRDAHAHSGRDNAFYLVMDSQRCGFADASFDVIVCNHVYEHVPDAGALMTEIRRLLKPGGVCYFGAGNRLSLMEPHYRLPLLSVVPKWLAHYYVRLCGRSEHYYENHLTYWGLTDLVSDFELNDYTMKVVQDPVRYHAADMVRPGSSKQKVVLALLRHAYWLCPTYLWLLRKR